MNIRRLADFWYPCICVWITSLNILNRSLFILVYVLTLLSTLNTRQAWKNDFLCLMPWHTIQCVRWVMQGYNQDSPPSTDPGERLPHTRRHETCSTVCRVGDARQDKLQHHALCGSEDCRVRQGANYHAGFRSTSWTASVTCPLKRLCRYGTKVLWVSFWLNCLLSVWEGLCLQLFLPQS